MKKGKILLSGLDPRFPYSNILISKLFLAYGSHGLVSWELGRARKARDPYRTWPWPIGAGCEICTAIQAQQLSKQSIWVKWLGEILWLRLMTARLYADGPTCHVLFPYYSHYQKYKTNQKNINRAMCLKCDPPRLDPRLPDPTPTREPKQTKPEPNTPQLLRKRWSG